MTAGVKQVDIDNISYLSISEDKPSRWKILISLIKTYRLAAELDCDVFHIHEIPLIFVGVFLKLIHQRKVVMDFHEDFEADILSKKYLPRTVRYLFLWLYKPVKRYLVPMFDFVIVAEDSYEQKYSHLSKRACVHNFPVVNSFQYQAELTESESLKICYVGAISVPRGAMNILDAVEALAFDESLNIELTLIGPIHTKSLEEKILASSRRSPESIKWLGKLPYTQVQDLVTEFDIGFAALHDEPNYRQSLPTKILEYNSAGVPAIVSDLPISHRFIVENVNGFIVPADSSLTLKVLLESLCHQREKLTAMRKTSRRFVEEHFSWETEYEVLESVYNAAVVS